MAFFYFGGEQIHAENCVVQGRKKVSLFGYGSKATSGTYVPFWDGKTTLLQ